MARVHTFIDGDVAIGVGALDDVDEVSRAFEEAWDRHRRRGDASRPAAVRVYPAPGEWMSLFALRAWETLAVELGHASDVLWSHAWPYYALMLLFAPGLSATSVPPHGAVGVSLMGQTGTATPATDETAGVADHSRSGS